MELAKDLVFLGGILSEEAVRKSSALNPAAKEWIKGLAGGLRGTGQEIRLIGHVGERMFPAGRLFPGEEVDFEREYEHHLVRYLNAKWLRSSSLTNGYYKAIERCFIASGQPRFLLNYNPYPWHTRACRKIKRAYGVKWINVTLDYDDPTEDDWVSYRKDTEEADGHVFLSHWGFENFDGQPKLHLDAGVERVVPSWHSRSRQPTFLYCGKINDYGGGRLLIEILKRLKGIEARVVVCGRGDAGMIEELKSLSVVDYRGFVTDQELHELSLQAWAFLNPRPPEFQDSRMIFPSKILNYAAYAKPVISTYTPGLHPDYRDYLLIPEVHVPEAYSRLIEEVCRWGNDQFESYGERLADYLEKNKLWQKQCRRLVDWLESEWGEGLSNA